MRKLFVLFLTGTLLLTACSKKDQTTDMAMDTIPAATDTLKGLKKYTGVFVSAPGKSVTGKALIFLENGMYSVGLENMNINSGPDLHVYLAKEKQATNFIDLGKLKAFKGNEVYPLTSAPDFSEYKYVLIYCQQFNVLFGSAELVKK